MNFGFRNNNKSTSGSSLYRNAAAKEAFSEWGTVSNPYSPTFQRRIRNPNIWVQKNAAGHFDDNVYHNLAKSLKREHENEHRPHLGESKGEEYRHHYLPESQPNE